MTGKIFISYRRDDTSANAGRLLDLLTSRLGADRLFFDVDNIEPGAEFREVVRQQVTQSAALLAVIGPHWIEITDRKGQRRLDDPHDLVRVEIETALTEKKLVIPVLVDNARMPGSEDLPDSLAPLALRNAITLTHARFRSDGERLVATLAKIIEPTHERVVVADEQVQLPDRARSSSSLWSRLSARRFGYIVPILLT